MATDAHEQNRYSFRRAESMTKRRYSAQPTEADLERAATDFLALDGWRALKTDPVSRRMGQVLRRARHG